MTDLDVLLEMFIYSVFLFAWFFPWAYFDNLLLGLAVTVAICLAALPIAIYIETFKDIG